MSAEMQGAGELEGVPPLETGRAGTWQRPDGRRTLQLALATVWMLDGILQLQPFMFTAGSSGFSGMLASTAPGNPSTIARTITWNASLVDHHAVVANSAFALIQVLIGFGIAWRPTVKLALATSFAWSLAVWWFGEGLGGVLHGTGTPLGGGPGAVLFYALLAVLLWPAERAGRTPPFVAARSVGIAWSRAIWATTWVGMAILGLLGSGRAPQGLRDLIQGLNAGQPGWLAAIDRHTASLVAGRGLTAAVTFAVLSVLVATGVYLPVRFARATVVVAVLLAVVIWVVGENLGMILVGGATDPNSGPVLVLLALAYWPRHRTDVARSADAASTDERRAVLEAA